MHDLNRQEQGVTQAPKRFDAKRGIGCAALLLALLAAASGQAIGADSCYALTSKSTPLVVAGDVFRQALLQKTVTTVNAFGATFAPAALPPGPTRCTGADPAFPSAALAKSNYFGNINSKQGFLKFVAQACETGAAYPHQYFSMGHAIYYRNCQGGQGNNYIYFWGVDNGTKSSCIGSTYPAMYQAFLDASPKNVVPSADDMASTFSGKGFEGKDPKAYALGNMMAAILIAESKRDYFVIPANYMLVDRLRLNPKSMTAAQIVAGHCVPSAATCKNDAAKQDGAHPLAWGGALETMMLGVFSGAAGANTDFGKTFERNLVLGWLTDKKLAQSVDAKQCALSKTYSTYPPAQQTTLTNLFAPLFAQ